MTLKMKNALMDYVLHPTDTYKKIAERNNVNYKTFCKAVEREQEFIREQSMKIWAEKTTMAQRVMESLAERGNYKALAFILQSNGIVPEQKIINTDQEIHISIEKNECKD